MTDWLAEGRTIALLTSALDECREARELLLLSHTGLADRHQRRWQGKGSVAGVRERFVASLAAQYLGENLRRARQHWLSFVECLVELGGGDASDAPRSLLAAVRAAGLDDVASLLDDDVVPRQRRPAAEHLTTVMNRMSECDRVVGNARNQLMLRRIRDERPSG